MKTEDCRSVIQDDFDEAKTWQGHCVHHVFQGPYRDNCEKYGFLVVMTTKYHALLHDRHPEWGLEYKQKCQEWYEQNVGSREEFIKEFGRNYL